MDPTDSRPPRPRRSTPEQLGQYLERRYRVLKDSFEIEYLDASASQAYVELDPPTEEGEVHDPRKPDTRFETEVPMTQNEFFHAVYRGDVDRVRRGLRERLVLDVANREGTEALFFAIEAGHEHIMHFLIESGANPFSRDALGRTAVHVAAFWNRVSIMEELKLLGLQLDVPAPGQWDATPLHYAASQGAEGAVRWLIGEGCSPEVKLSTGLRPADLARRNGHSQIAAFLSPFRLTESDSRSGNINARRRKA